LIEGEERRGAGREEKGEFEIQHAERIKIE